MEDKDKKMSNSLSDLVQSDTWYFVQEYLMNKVQSMMSMKDVQINQENGIIGEEFKARVLASKLIKETIEEIKKYGVKSKKVNINRYQ